LKLRKALLYPASVALLAVIVVSAVAVACYWGRGSFVFPVKGNIDPPYNQAVLVIEYKGDWIGGYSFEDTDGQRYFTQELNGTGNMQLTVNRPNSTDRWLIWSWVQGYSHVDGNLTLSVYLSNGTLIDSVTKNSMRYSMPISSIITNMETLTSSHS
jgi:hypothetical protein